MRVQLLAASVLISFQIVVPNGAALGEERHARVRDDAMLLMGAATWVPGVAAYCNKFVGSAPALIDAAAKWSERNDQQVGEIICAIRSVRGLTEGERRIIDRAAVSSIRSQVEGSENRTGFCNQAAQAITKGKFDFSNREDTAAALDRIMSFDVD